MPGPSTNHLRSSAAIGGVAGRSISENPRQSAAKIGGRGGRCGAVRLFPPPPVIDADSIVLNKESHEEKKEITSRVNQCRTR